MSFLNNFFNKSQDSFEELIIKGNLNKLKKNIDNNNFEFPQSIEDLSVVSYAINVGAKIEVIEFLIENGFSTNHPYGLTPFEMALEKDAEFKLFSRLIDKKIVHNSASRLPVLHQILDNEGISDVVEGATISYFLEHISDIDLNEEFQNCKPLTIKAYEQEKYLLMYLFLVYGASIKDVYDEYNELYEDKEKVALSESLLEKQPKHQYEYFLPFLVFEDFKKYIDTLDSTKDKQIIVLIAKNTLIDDNQKIALTKMALEKGANINETSTNNSETTALQYYCGCYTIGNARSYVNFLFENGADFDYNGRTPFLHIVNGADFEFAKYLLENKITDANTLTKFGTGALNAFHDTTYLNTLEKKVEMLDLLVKNGLDINLKVKYFKDDPSPISNIVDILINTKDEEFLEYILKTYDNLEIEGSEINRALTNDINDNICKLLIAKKPDYTHEFFYEKTIDENKYHYGAQALEIAISWDREEIAYYLIDAYPDMKAYTEAESLVARAYKKKYSLEFIKKLILRDPDINRLYYEERTNAYFDKNITVTLTTLLSILNRNYREEYSADTLYQLVEFLLDNGANANIPLKKFDVGEYHENEEHILLSVIDKNKDIKLLELLIEKGKVDPRKPVSNFQASQILTIVDSNFLNDDDLLFYLKYFDKKYGLDLEERDKFNSNLFLQAASSCRPKSIKYIIDKGVKDLNMIGGFDNNHAIHKAIANHYTKDKTLRAQTVETLLDAGANIELYNSEQLTPLMSAAKYGCLETLITIIEHGANINAKNESGINAANVVFDEKFSYDDAENMEENKSKILAVLKESGCDINNIPNEGSTPLNDAIGYGYKTIFNTLLHLNADINRKDNHGITPIMVATNFADIYFCEKLLQIENIDLSCEDNTGENLLYKAIKRVDNESAIALIEYFIQNNVEIRSLENGMNLISFAAYFCRYELLDLLSKYVKDDINLKDNNGFNALLWSVYSNLNINEEVRIYTIKKLIDMGININDYDENKKTALHWAVSVAYYSELLKELINLGADVNLTDNNGYTPMSYLVYNYFNIENYDIEYFKETIKLLVQNGANTTSALNLAKQIDEKNEIIEFIQSL